jgi:hypothetical protein
LDPAQKQVVPILTLTICLVSELLMVFPSIDILASRQSHSQMAGRRRKKKSSWAMSTDGYKNTKPQSH